jgi:AcrR family transcriptional regulator
VTEKGSLRELILDQASHFFIRYGYHGLSMRRIAEAVGVSKAALYYHFQDKEELFSAILERYLDTIENLIQSIEQRSGDAQERIRLLVTEILLQPEDHRALIRLASQEVSQLSPEAQVRITESYNHKFMRRIQSILELGMESGMLRVMNAEVATWALLGMMYPYFYPAQSRRMPDPDRVVEQLVSIFLEGVKPV